MRKTLLIALLLLPGAAWAQYPTDSPTLRVDTLYVDSTMIGNVLGNVTGRADSATVADQADSAAVAGTADSAAVSAHSDEATSADSARAASVADTILTALNIADITGLAVSLTEKATVEALADTAADLRADIETRATNQALVDTAADLRAAIGESGADTSGTGFLSSGGTIGGSVQITGDVKSTNVTASRAVVTDGSQNFNESATTATELGYVSGVTSAIQTQLGTKATNGAISDSLKAQYPTKPREMLSFGDWQVDRDFVPSLIDTVRTEPMWDSLWVGGYFPAIAAYHPDTSNVANTVDVISRPFQLIDYAGLDSILFYYATGTTSTTNNQIAVYVYEWTIAGGSTLLDSETGLESASNGVFVLNAGLAALSALTRFDYYYIRIQFQSKSITEWCKVGRLIVYPKRLN